MTDGIPGVKMHVGDDAEAYADAVAAGEVPPETQGAAGEGDPLEGLAGRAEADVRAAFRPSVLRAVLALRGRDRGEFVALRARLKAVGVTLSQWDKALAEVEKSVEREERAHVHDDVFGGFDGGPESHALEADPYAMRPGVITKLVEKNDGSMVRTVIARFSARITAEVELSDGTDETTRTFEIEAFVAGQLRTVRVPAVDFRRMDWVEALLGAEAVVEAGAGTRDSVRAAIQTLSSPVPKRREYGFTGWTHINGQPDYLHAAGALRAEASVHVPGRLAQLALPAPLAGEALRTGVRACLELFFCGPADLTVPVFCAPWRAALGKPKTVIYVQAEPEVGKTTMACWAQNHFATTFSAKALPETWKSTAFGINYVLATAGDCVLLIDDFTWRGDAGADAKALDKLDDVVRNAFGGTSRTKGTADSRIRRDREARALLMITGEALPKRDSIMGRMVLVQMVERLPLTAAQVAEYDRRAAEGVYAGTMAAFLSWLAPRYDELHEGELAGIVDRVAEELRADGGSPRNARELADLGAGLRYLLRFARDCGALTKEEAADVWQRAKAGLVGNRAAQRETQGEEEACARFLGSVRAALLSGGGHLAWKDGKAPPEAEALRCGWVVRDSVTGRSTTMEGSPIAPALDHRGPRLGFTDGEHVWLVRDVAFSTAQRVARDGGEPLAVEKRGLTDRLHRRGMLAKVETDAKTGSIKSKTVRLMVSGNHMSGMLAFRSDVFWGVAESDDAQGPESNSEGLRTLKSKDGNAGF